MPPDAIFCTLRPNSETVDAMLAARRGEMVEVGSVEDLLADRYAEDDQEMLSQASCAKPLL
ncbi:MAG TPA: hypothetical protein VGD64_01635 [Acidisarcina sp.]